MLGDVMGVQVVLRMKFPAESTGTETMAQYGRGEDAECLLCGARTVAEARL